MNKDVGFCRLTSWRATSDDWKPWLLASPQQRMLQMVLREHGHAEELT